MLLGIDAFAAVTSTRMRHLPIKMSYGARCLCLCLMYFLIGMKVCRGLGVVTVLIVGLSNGLLMLPFVLWVVPTDPPHEKKAASQPHKE